MSLQLAAQHMASRGRGPDTTLVHMAPQEVAGLQALAKAHGGSLTINPDTGLPEAGFLSSILPLVAGAFLGPAGLGLTAMQTGLAVGALGTAATGSLSKGLMAGLGAYGGAGLAGGLMGAGAAGAPGAYVGGLEGIGVGSSQGINAMDAMSDMAARGVGAGAQSSVASTAANVIPDNLYATNPEALATNAYSANPVQAQQAVLKAAPQVVTKAPVSFTDNTSQAFQGFKNLGTPEGREAFLGKAATKTAEATGVGGYGGLFKSGLMGLAPAIADYMTPEQRAIEEKAKLKPTNFNFAFNQDVNPDQRYTGAFTGERTHFNPVYTPIAAAGGGLMDIGPVESMSRSNQSQMAPAYAQGGVSDMAVNPYTGAEMFAEGGNTKAVRPVEEDPYYTMSGQSGDAFKYLMGQMPAAPRAPAPVAAAPVAQPAVQPVAAQPRGIMGMVMRGLGGESSNATMRPYTFDPATGTFTAMPIVDPNAADFDLPAASAAPTPFSRQEDSYGFAQGGIASLAQGGPSHLGDYSDGGRFLRNADGGTTSDGVSDSIPASIGGKRPARLAENEFVIPARIVSELGNGSSEAGARRLYAMMERIQKARGKTVGKGKVAVDTKAEKFLPA